MSLTIGIPAYNEEKNIARTIENVVPQLSSKDEILIVASGCTDRTVDIVRKFMKKNRKIKLIVESERRGKSSAVNLILKNARGKIIVFTDADVKILKNAIKKLVRHFNDAKVGAVGGRLLPVLSGSYIDFWSAMSYRIMNARRKKQSENGSLINISGNLMAVRRGVVKEIPLESLVDDSTLSLMIKLKGYKILYEPEAKVEVRTPTSMLDLIKQRARIRAGYLQLKKWFKTEERSLIEEASNYLLKEFSKLKSVKERVLFLIVGASYLFSWIYGWWLLFRKKSHLTIWKRVESTK